MYTNYQVTQELKTDFINIAKCWMFSVLFYHQIYPKSAFEMRTIYGTPAPVSVSQKLNQYVDKLFKQFEANFKLVNYLQIELTSEGNRVSSYRLCCQILQCQYYSNRHQKQTQLKFYIRNLQNSLQKSKPITQNPSFNFYIEQRYDNSQKVKAGKFIDNWIIDALTKEQSGEELVGVGLKLADFNLVVTKVDYN